MSNHALQFTSHDSVSNRVLWLALIVGIVNVLRLDADRVAGCGDSGMELFGDV